MALTIAGQDRIAAAHCMLGTKWRRLPVGRQTLLVVARLPKGETTPTSPTASRSALTTVCRSLREGIEVLAALAPTLNQAIAPWRPPRRS